MNSNLRSALVDLVDPAEIGTVALAITSLIDGLWLRAGLQAGGITSAEALEQIADYLRYRVRHFDIGADLSVI